MEVLEVFTLTDIIHITAAGTIHGTPMVAGVVIHIMEAITAADTTAAAITVADTMVAAITAADTMVADTMVAVIGAVEWLIATAVTMEGKTIQGLAARIQRDMVTEEVLQ